MPPQKSPGPANFKLNSLVGYNNHDFNSLKKRAPQWSFGRRSKGYSDDKTPGAPNYDTRKITRYGKFPNVPAKISEKVKERKLDNLPGSNRYNPIDVTIYKSHGGGKYSIGIKTKTSHDQCGPGPVSNIVHLDIYRKRAPKYAMFGPSKDLSDGRSPGPNQYSADTSKLKTMKNYPAYSMRARTSNHSKDKVPGPADYNLIKLNPFAAAPCYTLRRQHSEYINVLILPNDNC